MKAIKEYAVPFVIGATAALFAQIVLTSLWVSLGWRKPVADWMVAVGLPTTVAAYWAMVWINLPSWLVAIGTGLFVGMIRRQSPWKRFALVTCLGFIATPHLLILIAFGGWYPGAAGGASIWIQTFLWEAVAIPLLLLGAWLVLRRQRPATGEVSGFAST